MQNYFNYYTEIEDHFQRRRGTLLLLSTLDWALIATWQEAGFPLRAVLAGIDATFDRYESRKAKGRTRAVNGLAYCAQEVLRAVEEMHEAATGAGGKSPTQSEESGFENARITAYLQETAMQLRSTKVPAAAQPVFTEISEKLTELALSAKSAEKSPAMETLEQHLLAMEDQLFAALQTFSTAEYLLVLRERSARELAPYRSRLQTTQIRQIEQQFLRRSLFEKNNVPRLSLFYMRQQ